MHHTHTPHPPDESAPTVAMALGGLPGQRLPSDAPVLDEATREVPVVRPPDADEPDAGYDAGEDPAAAPGADGDDPTGAEAQANGDAHDDQPEETADAADDPGADDTAEPDAEPAAEMDIDLGSAPYAAAETAVVDEPLAAPEPGAEVEAEADEEDRPAEPTEPEPEAEDGPTADIDVEEEPMFYAATTEEAEETGEAAPPATAVGHLSALDGDLTDEEPTAEEPTDDEPTAEEPTAEEPTAEEPTDDEAGPEESTAGGATAEEPPAEETPAEETPAEETPAEPAPLRPGDLVEMPIALWTAEAAQRFRDEWRELQVLFIDEPAVAVAEAKNLVTEVVHTLSDTLLSEQDEFDPRRTTANPDTEAMRVAMRRYRDFLERVLAL